MAQLTKTFFVLIIIEALCHLVVSGVLASSFCVVDESSIIDQAGRSISTKRAFKRIISLYGAHTENLFALGLEKEIIGVSRNEAFPEKAKTKPVFSYHDDPEKFLAACPDLVLIRPMIDRGYPQLMARLEKSKITVVSLQPATIDEMFNYWKILGILTGRQNEASDMTRHFKRRVSLLKSRTKDLTLKKKVYFEVLFRQKYFFL